MNIGSSTTYQRPGMNPVQPRRRPSDVSLSYDDSGRRMNHTPFQPAPILNSFWSMIQHMPRKEQISLAATAVASQAAQSGINRDNRDFLRSFKTRFSAEELQNILGQVRQHPLVQKKPAGTRDEFLRAVQEILAVPASVKADDPRTPAPALPRSPEELFLRMSMNQPPNKKKPGWSARRVSSVELGGY